MNIFPIPLSASLARRITNEHARAEFEEFVATHSWYAKYTFSGNVHPDGSADVTASYTYDNGYASGSGAWRKIIPGAFTTEQVEHLKQGHMLTLAQEAYEQRELAKRTAEICQLAKELFGEQFKGADVG